GSVGGARITVIRVREEVHPVESSVQRATLMRGRALDLDHAEALGPHGAGRLEGALPERCRALAGTARAQLELEVPLRLLHADERRRDADGEPPVPQIAAAERESTGGRAPSAGP